MDGSVSESICPEPQTLTLVLGLSRNNDSDNQALEILVQVKRIRSFRYQ